MDRATSKCSGATAIRYKFRKIAALTLLLQLRCSIATLALLLIYNAHFRRVYIKCVDHDANIHLTYFKVTLVKNNK